MKVIKNIIMTKKTQWNFNNIHLHFKLLNMMVLYIYLQKLMFKILSMRNAFQEDCLLLYISMCTMKQNCLL